MKICSRGIKMSSKKKKKTVEVKNKRIKCPKCVWYLKPKELARHMREAHPIEPQPFGKLKTIRTKKTSTPQRTARGVQTTRTSSSRCRFCDAIAMPGESLCYNCAAGD